MRLGQGIGGKAFFVLTGRQEELEAALESAQATLKQIESFVRTDLIPRPDEEALAYF
jgi:microcompartment protein CcmL/EutN